MDYFAKKRNDKLKEVYIREWDEPHIDFDYAKEKFQVLKQIWQGQQFQNLMDIVQLGLPEDVNISPDKFHIPLNDHFFRVYLNYKIAKENKQFWNWKILMSWSHRMKVVNLWEK